MVDAPPALVGDKLLARDRTSEWTPYGFIRYYVFTAPAIQQIPCIEIRLGALQRTKLES